MISNWQFQGHLEFYLREVRDYADFYVNIGQYNHHFKWKGGGSFILHSKARAQRVEQIRFAILLQIYAICTDCLIIYNAQSTTLRNLLLRNWIELLLSWWTSELPQNWRRNKSPNYFPGHVSKIRVAPRESSDSDKNTCIYWADENNA